MSKISTVWPIAAHTTVKHDLLRGYLGAWFPIIAKYNNRVVFIDGFAGPGTYTDGSPGSPAIALSTLLDHGYFAELASTEFVFVFNEMDKARSASLESVIEADRLARGGWPSNVKVVVENQNFTDVAEYILGSLGTKTLAPTFAFLDPFGYKDIPMAVIQRLMAFSRSELFVYVDINSLTRFATSGQQDDNFGALFGTDEFKNAPKGGEPGRKEFLHDLYKDQLVKLCGFPFVQSFEMVGANGKPINYLFFCTRHAKGFDAMKTTMWKAAPSGDFRYRDSLAGQTVLFQPTPDTGPLQLALRQRFGGDTVDIAVIVDFVITSTPYVSTHVKTRTLVPMQKAGMITSPNQRKSGQFPPGTLVTFLPIP